MGVVICDLDFFGGAFLPFTRKGFVGHSVEPENKPTEQLVIADHVADVWQIPCIEHANGNMDRQSERETCMYLH